MSKMVLSQTLTFEIADYQALLVNYPYTAFSIAIRATLFIDVETF
jgi:hypothetical protein